MLTPFAFLEQVTNCVYNGKGLRYVWVQLTYPIRELEGEGLLSYALQMEQPGVLTLEKWRHRLHIKTCSLVKHRSLTLVSIPPSGTHGFHIYRRNCRSRLQSYLRYVCFCQPLSQHLIYSTLSIFSVLCMVTVLNIITSLTGSFYGILFSSF